VNVEVVSPTFGDSPPVVVISKGSFGYEDLLSEIALQNSKL